MMCQELKSGILRLYLLLYMLFSDSSYSGGGEIFGVRVVTYNSLINLPLHLTTVVSLFCHCVVDYHSHDMTYNAVTDCPNASTRL